MCHAAMCHGQPALRSRRCTHTCVGLSAPTRSTIQNGFVQPQMRRCPEQYTVAHFVILVSFVAAFLQPLQPQVKCTHARTEVCLQDSGVDEIRPPPWYQRGGVEFRPPLTPEGILQSERGCQVPGLKSTSLPPLPHPPLALEHAADQRFLYWQALSSGGCKAPSLPHARTLVR